MKQRRSNRSCLRCGWVKSLKDFRPDQLVPDGISLWCKACRKEYGPYAYQEARQDYLIDQRLHDKERQEKHSEIVRSWRQRNPDTVKAQRHARRARERAAAGSFSAAEWKELKARHNYTCLRCHRKEPEIKLTPDHVVPLDLGGSNGIDNIQPLCRSCNCSKKNKTVDYRSV